MTKLLATLVCLSFFSIPVIAQHKNITGFSAGSAQEQLKLEQQFDSRLEAANIGNNIRELSLKPHHLGSPGGKAVADSIASMLSAYGWTVRIDAYQVLFPTPKLRQLEMIAPTKYTALLKEPVLKEDATSGEAGQLPSYNAWSADGDVTGSLVFVNYGLPDDYEYLDRLGIDVRGKIVIAKYGRSWRGIKPKVAQEHGAIGCIIYSDPADDGYVSGDVYPTGAYKNEYGVQRGSVMDLPVYPGDPITPGKGATANAKRLNREDAVNLLKIPVIPISYHDAKPLLASLDGPAVPVNWAGALPFTYHIGSGKTKVHLKLSFNWDITPCYNVVATIPGSLYPDEWVMRGNHHDAWVNGASDPISGVASLLEEAKAIGALLKTGWRPKRTLAYCAWDGEEPALLGSTEFVEDHLKELQQKVVVYINSDGNGRGFLNAGGSHALQTLVNEVARDVIDPQTKVSVLDRALARNAVNASSVKTRKEALAKKQIDLQALGSGSDFSPFLQFAGIPALSLEYGGEDGGGEYHTIYDSYDDYRRFKDPGFHYGVTLAQTIGRTALRLANADILPFDYTHLWKALNDYTNELINMTTEMREEALLEKQLRASNSYAIAADTAKRLKSPKEKTTVPFIDFSPLQNAVASLKQTADTLHTLFGPAHNAGSSPAAKNKILYTAEQQLLLPDGLPRRPWYKHAVYAPGLYSGYGVKTLPMIREAIEQRNWREAEKGIHSAAGVIQQLSSYLKQIR